MIHSIHQALCPVFYNMNSYRFAVSHIKYYRIYEDFPDFSHKIDHALYVITESCTDICHEPL